MEYLNDNTDKQLNEDIGNAFYLNILELKMVYEGICLDCNILYICYYERNND